LAAAARRVEMMMTTTMMMMMQMTMQEVIRALTMRTRTSPAEREGKSFLYNHTQRRPLK